MHLLNASRFTGPPVSAMPTERTLQRFDDVIELSSDAIKRSRLQLLKPMTKNFDRDVNAHRYAQEVHTIGAYDLNKELFDFENDTRDVNQPAMFTEYIRMFAEDVEHFVGELVLSSRVLPKTSGGKANSSNFTHRHQNG